MNDKLFIHKYQPLYFADFDSDNEVIKMIQTLILIDNLNKVFIPYLNRKGKAYTGLDFIMSAEMEPGIVAALLKYVQNDEVKKVLISNSRENGFEHQVDLLARQYLDDYSGEEARNLAKTYVLSEELYHSTQPLTLQGLEAELDATVTLYEYFSDMAEKFEGEDSIKYHALTQMAEKRYGELSSSQKKAA